jgi:hypothetical protein
LDLPDKPKTLQLREVAAPVFRNILLPAASMKEQLNGLEIHLKKVYSE